MSGSSAASMSNLVCCIHVTAMLLFLLGINISLIASQSTSFAFKNFTSLHDFIIVNQSDVSYQNSSLYLNKFTTLSGVGNACGKVLYKDMVRMQELSTGAVASFSTSFTFEITGNPNSSAVGDGFVFFFATDNYTTQFPGGYFCVLPWNGDGSLSNKLFAVEFDTFLNMQFNDSSNNHIGVDVNSMHSIAQYNLCGLGGNLSTNCSYLYNGGRFTAWIDYNSTTQTLNVRFASGSKPAVNVISLSNLDLSMVFNEYMYVGLSGGTGYNTEIHKIESWSFNSSLMSSEIMAPSPGSPNSTSKVRATLIWSVCGAGMAALILLLGVIILLCRCCSGCQNIKSRRQICRNRNSNINHLIMQGPRMFTYQELSKATKNFGESEILGSGGFGAVYKGTLQPSGTLVAVKRCSKPGSKHATNGFVAEAASISQIRHRNLVQLQGWCDEKGSGLLLVYDYMPNKSLDQWIFNDSTRGQEPDAKCDHPSIKTSPLKILSWDVRYNILAGVSAALAYLHEEWQQCVLHRDIKSSNVMLDADFNAHLGDFGLARLIDHKKMEKTTMMAGTLGYMAPEMYYTGKATKETDVYSFGVLVLEVVCGRRALDVHQPRPEDLVLVECVWRAHDSGNLLHVVSNPSSVTTDSSSGVGHHNLGDHETGNLLNVASNPIFVTTDSSSGVSHHSGDHETGNLLNVVSNPSFVTTDSSSSGVSSHHLGDQDRLINLPATVSAPTTGGDMNHPLAQVAFTAADSVKNLLSLGLLCCHPDPNSRPTMGLVNRVFQSRDMATLPPLPAFKPQMPYTAELSRAASEVLGYNHNSLSPTGSSRMAAR